MSDLSMLTTIDNPYDPFDQFEEWSAWDTSHGYNSASLLAHVAVLSDDISDADQALAIDQAIDEIVKENVSGMFVKVTRSVADT